MSMMLTSIGAASLKEADEQANAMQLMVNGERCVFVWSSSDTKEQIDILYENGSMDTVTHIKDTGERYYNGRKVNIRETLEARKLSDHYVVAAEGGWVKVDYEHKLDIDISGMTAAAAVALILSYATTVSPATATVVGTVVAKFLDDNVSGVVAVSLKTLTYYWEPIPSSGRPRMKYEYYLYGGLGCKEENLLCSF